MKSRYAVTRTFSKHNRGGYSQSNKRRAVVQVSSVFTCNNRDILCCRMKICAFMEQNILSVRALLLFFLFILAYDMSLAIQVIFGSDAAFPD